jgi:hypothetical protein
MRRLREDGKNVLGEDGQFEQQQWKMPEGVQEDRSVR